MFGFMVQPTEKTATEFFEKRKAPWVAYQGVAESVTHCPSPGCVGSTNGVAVSVVDAKHPALVQRASVDPTMGDATIYAQSVAVWAFDHHIGDVLVALDVEDAKQLVNRLGEAIAMVERLYPK